MTIASQHSDGSASPVAGFRRFTLAMIQLGSIGESKAKNLAHTRRMIQQAAKGQAPDYEQVDLIMLPEIFNSPMSCSAHRINAEVVPDVPPGQVISASDLPSEEDSPTSHMLSKVAREVGCWIIGGSMPEKAAGQADDDPRTWNTLTVWNDQGDLVGKYRKMHMYDVDIPGEGGITMKESSVITPGNDILIVDMPFGTIGLAICYDIRFPHLLAAMLQGNKDICAYLLPSAFNTTTGPLAWEILQRVRAIDNQIFVGMCSPARNEEDEYVSYGHSLLCGPNGQVISTPTPEDESEGIVYATLDPALMAKTRQWLPVYKSQRTDIYTAPQLRV